jgi:GGDEF domain-containing protein
MGPHKGNRPSSWVSVVLLEEAKILLSESAQNWALVNCRKEKDSAQPQRRKFYMVKPPNTDRRIALGKRRRVAEMSPAEMLQELLTSEVTGLPNRRAFDEADLTPAVAMSDVDGLKALNDKYGYYAGDALLQAKAVALQAAGLDAYHDKGDEFLYRGNNIKKLKADLARAREVLRNRLILVECPDGSTHRLTGADFSFGVGNDLNEAEFALKNHKAEREARGEIARGELRGIRKSEKPGELVVHPQLDSHSSLQQT